MEPKRVLFFGVTGIEKTGGEKPEERGVLKRLAVWAERFRTRTPRPRVVDFEAQYLFEPSEGGTESDSFLDDPQEKQCAVWRRTWLRFVKEIAPQGNADLFVAMHGCIVRGHYGVRSVVGARDVAEGVRPDLIVTLLDDVYDMWWRTEMRAGDNPWVGRPTIEQLIFARRAELIVADQVAHSVDPPIPHFVISVAHPCETLANRIYSAKPTVVYLCFPISAPRDLKTDEGDPSGETEIMEFLQEAYDRQARNPDLVFVCPLGIDELPLNAVAKEQIRTLDPDTDISKTDPIVFDRESLRWVMDPLWAPDGCLSPGPPPPGDRPLIPLAQLEAAAGMIHSDVGWRDYRLVEQVKQYRGPRGCLAAFNPKFRNRNELSRSVGQEIDFATSICPVYVYQNRKHDPKDVFESRYPRKSGTMSIPPKGLMVVRKDTVKEVFDEIEELARRNAR